MHKFKQKQPEVNLCKYCSKTVTARNGLKCQGTCQSWAHYKCLHYTPDKIINIKDGYIDIDCPCPNCDISPLNKGLSKMHPMVANPTYNYDSFFSIFSKKRKRCSGTANLPNPIRCCQPSSPIAESFKKCCGPCPPTPDSPDRFPCQDHCLPERFPCKIDPPPQSPPPDCPPCRESPPPDCPPRPDCPPPDCFPHQGCCPPSCASRRDSFSSNRPPPPARAPLDGTPPPARSPDPCPQPYPLPKTLTPAPLCTPPCPPPPPGPSFQPYVPSNSFPGHPLPQTQYYPQTYPPPPNNPATPNHGVPPHGHCPQHSPCPPKYPDPQNYPSPATCFPPPNCPSPQTQPAVQINHPQEDSKQACPSPQPAFPSPQQACPPQQPCPPPQQAYPSQQPRPHQQAFPSPQQPCPPQQAFPSPQQPCPPQQAFPSPQQPCPPQQAFPSPQQPCPPQQAFPSPQPAFLSPPQACPPQQAHHLSTPKRKNTPNNELRSYLPTCICSSKKRRPDKEAQKVFIHALDGTENDNSAPICPASLDFDEENETNVANSPTSTYPYPTTGGRQPPPSQLYAPPQSNAPKQSYAPPQSFASQQGYPPPQSYAAPQSYAPPQFYPDSHKPNAHSCPMACCVCGSKSKTMIQDNSNYVPDDLQISNIKQDKKCTAACSASPSCPGMDKGIGRYDVIFPAIQKYTASSASIHRDPPPESSPSPPPVDKCECEKDKKQPCSLPCCDCSSKKGEKKVEKNFIQAMSTTDFNQVKPSSEDFNPTPPILAKSNQPPPSNDLPPPSSPIPIGSLQPCPSHITESCRPTQALQASAPPETPFQAVKNSERPNCRPCDIPGCSCCGQTENTGQSNRNPDFKQANNLNNIQTMYNTDSKQSHDKRDAQFNQNRHSELDGGTNDGKTTKRHDSSQKVLRCDDANTVLYEVRMPERCPSDTETEILIAMDDMCQTVGLFTKQFESLMGRVTVALDEQGKNST